MGRWPFFQNSKRTLLLDLPGHQFRRFWVTSLVIYITQRDQSCQIFISKFFFKHSLLDSALKVEVNCHTSIAWEWRDGSAVLFWQNMHVLKCIWRNDESFIKSFEWNDFSNAKDIEFHLKKYKCQVIFNWEKMGFSKDP